ncbi:hypothetical protein N9L80_02805 [Luminiphilus sp.]|nr:hypothetical protein [Luminiphilus sp.]
MEQLSQMSTSENIAVVFFAIQLWFSYAQVDQLQKIRFFVALPHMD